MSIVDNEGLVKVFRALNKLREVREDMTLRQAQIFVGTCVRDNILRMDLRRSVDIGEGVMTRSLDQLIDRGWLDTREDYDDPRQLRVYLTKTGRAMCDELIQITEK